MQYSKLFPSEFKKKMLGSKFNSVVLKNKFEFRIVKKLPVCFFLLFVWLARSDTRGVTRSTLTQRARPSATTASWRFVPRPAATECPRLCKPLQAGYRLTLPSNFQQYKTWWSILLTTSWVKSSATYNNLNIIFLVGISWFSPLSWFKIV